MKTKGRINDIVVGFAEGCDVARFYATETGRDLVLVNSVDRVPHALEAGLRSCVVSAGASLSTRDLSAIAARASSARVQLGLVHGWAGESTAFSHASKMVSYHPRWPDSALIWSGFPGLPEFDAAQPQLRVLASDTDKISFELARGHRLICIETHGNGVDAPLGTGQQLCARRSLLERRPGRTSMPCLHGGPCIRGGDDGSDAVHQIGPAEVHADVLVWSTCWGILTSDSPFDPSTSLGAEFARSTSIATLLTTFTSVVASPHRLLAIAGMLSESMSVGEVAMHLNGMREPEVPAPWIVLGDPLMLAFPSSRLPTVAISSDTAETVDLPSGLIRCDLMGQRPGQIVMARPEPPDEESGINLHMAISPNRPGYFALHTGQSERRCTLSVANLHDSNEWALLKGFRKLEPALRFLLGFPRWARQSPHLSSWPAAEEVESQAERVLVRIEQVRAWKQPEATLSGDASRMTRLLRQENHRVRRLNEAVIAYFYDYLTTASGVLSHTYGPYASVASAQSTASCPYCGSSVDSDRYRLPSIGTARTVLRCLACTNIADLPVGWASVNIIGPSEINAGESESYQIQLTADQERKVDRGLVRIGVQHVPFPVVDSGIAGVLETSHGRTFRGIAEIRIQEDTPVGVYFMVAVLAIDGEVITARRPLIISRQFARTQRT